MAVVSQFESVLTIEYKRDLSDKDSQCSWAEFYFDLCRYSLTISSDCGNFSGCWQNHVGSESFLYMCSKFSAAYLKHKLSWSAEVDGLATCNNIQTYLQSKFTESELDEMCLPDLSYACNYSKSVEDVASAILQELKGTPVERHLIDTDIYECIATKRIDRCDDIVHIYITHIVPELRVRLASQAISDLSNSLPISVDSIVYVVDTINMCVNTVTVAAVTVTAVGVFVSGDRVDTEFKLYETAFLSEFEARSVLNECIAELQEIGVTPDGS